MKATLIYNTKAGNTQSLSPDELQEALREAGYQPSYEATRSMEELDAILDGVEGLVVSAGGDGTAKAVAMRLIGNDKAALAILPMGTANNLTRTLCITGKPLEIVKRLNRPHKHKFDLGHITAPWGEDYFIEGAGFGFFAQVLAAYDPDKGKSITRSIKSIVEVIRDGYGQHTTLRLPDQEISTEFLLVEILNTCSVGPRLKFAPDADPTDGLLHVVCIDGEQRESYFQYMSSLLTEEMAELPSVATYVVPHLEIAWKGFPFHVDDYVRPFDFDFHNENEEMFPLRRYPDVPEEATIHVEVLPQALSIWLPEPEDGEEYNHEN